MFVRKSLILFHYSWSQLDRWAILYVESKNKIHVDADFADFWYCNFVFFVARLFWFCVDLHIYVLTCIHILVYVYVFNVHFRFNNEIRNFENVVIIWYTLISVDGLHVTIDCWKCMSYVGVCVPLLALRNSVSICNSENERKYFTLPCRITIFFQFKVGLT